MNFVNCSAENYQEWSMGLALPAIVLAGTGLLVRMIDRCFFHRVQNRPSELPSSLSGRVLTPSPELILSKESLLSQMNSLGQIEIKEMALIIAAKQRENKSHHKSIFVIDDLESFFNSLNKLLNCPTKSKYIRLQYVTRISGHSTFGEAIIDKSGVQPHLKIFMCDPSFACNPNGYQLIEVRKAFSSNSTAKVTIFLPQDNILLKGKGCSYCSLDGAFMLTNQEKFEDLYVGVDDSSSEQNFQITQINLPTRLKRGSQYYYDDESTPGIKSTIFESLNGSKIVNGKGDDAKKSVGNYLRTVEDKVYNMRVENKMNHYQVDVDCYLKKIGSMTEIQLEEAIKPYTPAGFKAFCAKELV